MPGEVIGRGKIDPKELSLSPNNVRKEVMKKAKEARLKTDYI